ncbi:MAG: hypothetical protein IKN38_01325 [Clostridia bacterium]|nr:hypothetical protein [Clostridia bacterium]
MKILNKILSLLVALIIFVLNVQSVSFAVVANENTPIIESIEEYKEVSFDINDDFEDNVVMVTLKKEYSDPTVKITKDIFPDIDIKNIENYIISDPDDNFTRDIAITGKILKGFCLKNWIEIIITITDKEAIH